MPVSNQFKIIIVGGGPAGLATALHLARRAPGLAADLLIMEAQEHPRPKLCGGGITIHGEEQLEALGIHIDVPSFRVDNLIFRLGKQDFTVPYPNAMRIIQRAQFDAALARAAQAQGLRMHMGERLIDIAVTDGGAIVTSNRGEYRARVVVAADGANSAVRRKLRFRSEAGVARLLRVLTPMNRAIESEWDTHTAVFDFSCVHNGVQGYLWEFPAYFDGQPYMNRGIFDSRIAPTGKKQPHGNFKHTFAAWLAQRGVALDDVPLQGHPVRWFSPTAEFSRPHVLLTGDAAGVDALFAEGISYAMEYGDIAVDAICDAFERNDFAFADYRARLLSHRMGDLLRRRAAVARVFYRHRVPPFWWVFWKFAGFAWPAMQQSIGAWMAVLPPKDHQATAYFPIAEDVYVKQ